MSRNFLSNLLSSELKEKEMSGKESESEGKVRRGRAKAGITVAQSRRLREIISLCHFAVKLSVE